MDLTRIHEAEIKTHHAYVAFAKKHQLSYGQLAVIATVSEGPCRQKDICDLWLLTKQTVNTICVNYIKAGWLENIDDPKDKRSKLLRLTALGQEEAGPIAKKLWDMEKRVLNQLTTEEIEWYERTAMKFANLIEEEVNSV